ncbi:hypothetical protein O3P69_007104 [Scylla paramamosain]|uniref:Receptor ligand binding region domain-containing protein n=1 Tax=Scylla paramamosain TaxID=85552 RepID=A0AAW0V1D0_SCYPA
MDTCEIRPRQVTLNPDAQAFIVTLFASSLTTFALLPAGVVVSASQAGDGLYGCGQWRGAGIAAYNALRWSLARANLDTGGLGSRIVSDSFVPGVKFGLHVYDSCGRDSRAAEGVGEVFPVLREGPSSASSCPSASSSISSSSNDTLQSLGVMDLTGATATHPGLASLLRQYKVPVLHLPPDKLLPPLHRGQALVEFLGQLGWTSASLLTAQDQYSLSVAKVVTEEAPARNVCLSTVVKVPSLTQDDPSLDPAQVELQYRHLVRTAVASGRVSGVVVVATGQVLLQILRAVQAESSNTRGLVWLLSDLPEDDLDLVRDIARLVKGLQVVGTAPPAFEEFEEHWRTLQDVKLEPTPDNEWVLSYLQQEKGCSLDPELVDKEENGTVKLPPVCLSFRMKEDELDVLARSRAVLAPVHGLFTILTALKNAWRLKCRNRRGACPKLQKMSHEELLSDYLGPLRFQHNGPGSRSMRGLTGGKLRSDSTSRLSGSVVGLYGILPERGNNTVSVRQVMSFDNSTVDVLSPALLPRASTCPKGTCETCLTLSSDFMEQQNVTVVSEAEQHIFMPSVDHVVVVGLFPIHEPSPDGADCSVKVNGATLQEVEAFLWAVDQINQHAQLLPSTSLGALVLDTCGSRIRTMNQVTSLVKSSLPGININLDDVRVLVTSLDPETARVAGEMLSSLNVTSINIGPSQAHSPYTLQMSPPINMEAEAMVQILRFLGWDYVSLVVSSEDTENVAGAEAFRTVAQASRICVALDLKMAPLDPQAAAILADQMVEQLIEKAAGGARGLALFLTLEDTRVLLRAVQRAVVTSRLLRHQLVLLAPSTWGNNKEMLQEFEGDLGGVLVLRDGQRDVRDFIAHYRLLTPEKNTRNPWFTQYWRQEFGCVGEDCHEGVPLPVVPYISMPSTPRVVQALFSFGAALTQLIEHLCPQHDGTLCPGLPKWRQRTVLNEFLRNTEVSRVDKPSEYFQFTENFHGNAPLEVLSLVRRPSSQLSPTYEYEKVGRYVDSRLTLGNAMMEYHNGSFARMDQMASTCLSSCSTCQHQASDYLLVDSPDKLYLAVTLSVHQKGERPLECGSLDGDKGIQGVESVLWALDRLNNDPKVLPGVTLGAIVLDACRSKEKIVRDLTNFLTGRTSESVRKKVPSVDTIMGLVATGEGEDVRQVVDVTQPYAITTIATQATATAYANTHRFPTMLRLAPPNSVVGRAIASLLLYWRWEVFSIVYSESNTQTDIQKHLVKATETHGLKPIMKEAIPLKVEEGEYMLAVWRRLAEAAAAGARVVVALLEPHHAGPFLQTAAALRARGLVHQGDLVFIMAESPWPYINHESEALGMMVVRPINSHVPEFQSYFKSLSLANHTAYPWFHEFWAQTFRCQGASCFTGAARNLSNYKLQQAEEVVNTASAITILGRALERWRREACPGLASGVCEELTSDSQFRDKLFMYTRSLTSHGVDGRPITFTVEGHNSVCCPADTQLPAHGESWELWAGAGGDV